MSFKLQEAYNSRYIEGDAADFIIRTERDILDIISFCSEHDTSKVLLHEASLSPEFFDLKTTLAGTLLQKFANYHLRGAGLISLEKIKSERFKELIYEYNKGNLFRFFEDRVAAEKWLTQG